LIRAAGMTMIAVGILGLVLGLVLIQALTSDLRATVGATGSAVDTIEETVIVVGDLADGASGALTSASDAAASAADATALTSEALVEVATFLEGELAPNVEAIHRSIPGAIDAADAIDSTLGALSLFGLDYSPEEPFAESLRRIESALDGLPAEIRGQAEVLKDLGPAAGGAASDVTVLADDLAEMTATLGEMKALSARYAASVTEAETAVDETAGSLDQTVLLLRVVVVLAALGAAIVGIALISIDRVLELIIGPR
jgi:hypothetical protein